MSQTAIHRRRIAVIGGGITGLAAAHRLMELDPNCAITLMEAGPSIGGALRTERQDGFLLELGADNFITNVPWGVDLCRRVGLAGELIETNPAKRRALILHDGQLYPVPEGFMLMEPRALWPVLSSRLLSVRGKLRLLSEWLIRPRAATGDESLASFAQRRLGREAFERLVQPLVAGIYTADPAKLSLAATLPRFLEMERRDGGLIRGARKNRRAEKSSVAGENGTGGSGARYSLFVTPRDGMQALPEAVAARLPVGTVRLNAPVSQLEPRPAGGWNLYLAGSAERIESDAVILATPAPVAAKLAQSFDDQLSAALSTIPYAGTVLVLVGYHKQQLARPLDGFGFVVPEIEKSKILAGSFSSEKFPGRAPPEHVLLRVFLGGAMRPEMLVASDAEVRQIVLEELAKILGVRGEPRLFRIVRWNAAMPQYHLGHVERVADIKQRVSRWPGLEVAGNAYTGVGVPLCIRSGEEAAQRVCAAGK